MLEDYSYTMDTIHTKDGKRWRCSKRTSRRCYAFVIVNGGLIVRRHGLHNHKPDDYQLRNGVYYRPNECVTGLVNIKGIFSR